MRDILDGMRAFDIEIEGLHTETGPGVYEVAIRYDDALRAADKAALFKAAMKQIALGTGSRSRSWPSGTRTCPARAGTSTRASGSGGEERLRTTRARPTASRKTHAPLHRRPGAR